MEFFWYPELSEHLKMALLRRLKYHLGCKLIEIWKLWFMTSKVVYTWPSYRLNTAAVSYESSSWVTQLSERSQTAKVKPTLAANVWDYELKPASAKNWSGRGEQHRQWGRKFSEVFLYVFLELASVDQELQQTRQADWSRHLQSRYCFQNTPSGRECTCE